MNFELSSLDQLESESIHALRETAAEFERPVLLYSAGKDSSVLLWLAKKAFYPGKIPFTLLHVDTGFKFPEMYAFRDQVAREGGLELVVYRNQEAISRGTNPSELGTQACCSLLKTEALLQALREGGFQAAIGGARREEERSRAKERFFSFRDASGRWDPRNQRPELWNLYNGRILPGESMRIFPLSNWTEMDVWSYIAREGIPVAPLYFAAEREVVRRGGQLIPLAGAELLRAGERVEKRMCRYRTLGCMPCTGAVESSAQNPREILEELLGSLVSERATRVIDHDADCSMETKKREGYF